MSLNFAEVQRNVTEIANRQEYSIDVLYELMAAYGRSASSITKLRNGIINLADEKKDTILQRGVVYLKHVENADSFPSEVEKLEQDPLTARFNPRYLIATDLRSFAAKDTKKGNTLEIKWEDIDRNVDFFYGWTGDEVTDEKTEAVADRRAADKMKELYFEIEKINREKLSEKGSTFRHELNVFFTRLLFCLFAEDTKVFSRDIKSIFTSAIKNYTQTDGSDLDQFLDTLFKALDSEGKEGFTSPYSNFPYVNGTLFDTKRNIAIPKFNAQARKYILDCGSLNWSEINPDIFGSMFQSIVDEEHRATHGMHYTSVPNIMKTIEPLFLNELRDEFDKYFDNIPRLNKLHDRISKIKIFDPACGSGNFLIIAYKELRKLEHAIIDRIYEDGFKKSALVGKLSSRIELDNFYGIEIDDFACEVAVLSLYLAKHQMNIEFEKQFGKEIKLIPLKEKANIVQGNATRIDWQDVCPNAPRVESVNPRYEQGKLIDDPFEQAELLKELGEYKSWEEIYLISNPPYLGQRNQLDEHKLDLAHVFNDSSGKYKKLDYVCCWFMKGTEYIKGTQAKLAFVSTNSVTQGVQIEQLWPRLLGQDVEISYAYRPFKWVNSARDIAGVFCVVISLRAHNPRSNKYIFEGVLRLNAENINPYLIDGPNIIVQKAKNAINGMHKMLGGCQPREGGYLMLSNEEKERLLSEDNRIERFILPMIGSSELLNGEKKWCIWVEDNAVDLAKSIPEINDRISKVKAHRESGNSVERTFARVPYKFVTTRRPKHTQIVMPAVTTSAREYIPIGYIGREIIVNSRAYCLFDADLYYFAILSSRMHIAWVFTVSGRLGDAINYSSNICYNTFPIGALTDQSTRELNSSARDILFARENHSEKTLSELYDPLKMPEDLREAHHQNDLLVDRLYRQKPYNNDEERLADLFARYEQMTTKVTE